jgi:hypothetical protein
VTAVSRAINDDERDQLIRLAAYTARARTPVDRDGYHREILYKPQVEGPGRLVKAYRRLLGGLEAIGCDLDTAWSLLARMAVDSAPAMRTDIIRELLRRDAPARTAEIAASLDVVKDTAQLHLEDLSLLKVAAYDRGEGDKAPYMWSATEWLRDHWPSTTDDLYHPPPTPHKGSDSKTPNEGQNTHETQNVLATPYNSSVPGYAQPCTDTTHSPRLVDGRWTCPGCEVAS